MLICLGSLADPTFRHTLAALDRRGHPCEVVDLAYLVLRGHLRSEGENAAPLEIAIGDARWQITGADSVFTRLIDLAQHAPSPALSQRARALQIALIEALGTSEARVMNRPAAGRDNHSKPFHAARLARVTGARIPAWRLTSDPERIDAFVASCENGVILKGASGVKTWARAFDWRADAAQLASLSIAPAYLQERIVGPDVRVHSVAGRLFAERIECEEVDYRVAAEKRFTPCETPDAIITLCGDVAGAMAAPLLGIDFKIERETGRWFLLEANPMPCYEAYDRRAHGEISEAVTDWLTARDVAAGW